MDCTAPKRVFGLIMASIALRACARQFGEGVGLPSAD